MRITHVQLVAFAAIVIVAGGLTGTLAASPQAEAAGYHDVLYANSVTPASGGDSLRFFYNHRSNDNNYEWIGFYSGTTRSAIMLWDGSWGGCDGDKFCIIGENHQLSLSSQSSNVLVDDTLEVTQDSQVQGEVRGGSFGSTDGGPVRFNDPVQLGMGSSIESFESGGTTTYEYGSCDYWGSGAQDADYCPSGTNQVDSRTRDCRYCYASMGGTCYGETTRSYTQRRTCQESANKQKISFDRDGRTVEVTSGEGGGQIQAQVVKLCGYHYRDGSSNDDAFGMFPVPMNFGHIDCRNVARNDEVGVSIDEYALFCADSNGLRGTGWISEGTSVSTTARENVGCGW